MSFLYILLILFLVSSDMLVLSLIHKRNAKKCSYDCSTCKNWDCFKPYCDKKRSELNNANNS